MKLSQCPGCGASLPRSAGPMHRYIGASPACWAVFGEVLAREYSDLAYHSVHRFTVDTYAAQHPGISSRQSIQSVAAHLLGLYWTLEERVPLATATRRIGRAVQAGKRYGLFHWLEPPYPLGDVTILDVVKAQDPIEHAECVNRWASSVWRAWSPHHDQIRKWARGLANW